ncbi:hypothetical protein HBI56_140160 [Parastagonospora nodorum]|uniref:Uncharacterized protein n=1 Tax=Phaeosphaeria nodorum (strain SN15 / ATCC MYA-4574 / FGSC 10173) TaxID=321614 RepID=A0A7U2NPI5_PHANO|nr:hypothetical protein HBH56_127650 [Parastagonospora nodorum]QRD05728.1 hypothetical protein JI435_422710 [Parastagonospora nodorum SN15]KAH3931458.1 hypothetical protein HBH54_095850 [Parastagonospora nodorum]KAH3947422.1 hypothetical protein HBH53_117940 [Parastagonospora nodorum]KAH3970735.1 hypothetical protein HBH51_114360 [Parastagonospora nodorum]
MSILETIRAREQCPRRQASKAPPAFKALACPSSVTFLLSAFLVVHAPRKSGHTYLLHTVDRIHSFDS